MSETPTQEGGASQTGAPVLDKDTGKPKTPGRDPRLVERDELLARMDARVEEQRTQENEQFLASSDADPQAWLLHQRMTAEARGAAAPVVEQEEEADPIEVEPPPQAAAPKARPAERVSTKGEDPLSQYVVRVDGKPMFKTLVYGQEKLIPLEAARAELQKIGAGDERLRQAAAQKRELDARDAALRANEARLRAQPTAPAQVDDKALDAEAVELVRSLVTEPEAQAAARLAKTLKSLRQAPAPQIDVAAIRNEAAAVARQTLAEERTNLAMSEGFDAFKTTYQDIASDPELFAIADRKTDVIAAEHPEWSPQQVMAEAGRVTREWMTGLGVPKRAHPSANPAPSNRQQRKEGLRPMPTPRTAQPAPAAQDEGNQSAAELLAEIRKSRGQAL